MSAYIQVNDSECHSLELLVPEPCASQVPWFRTGYTIKGYAKFHGPSLRGKINFVSEHVINA